MTELILLGPQRLEPIVRPELERLGVGDRIASISAGWQEREGEIEDLAAHVEREVVDLELHRRTEQVWQDDSNLFRAHRARQDRLQAMQRLYRMRLDFALEPARRLLRRRPDGDRGLLEAEREAAVEAVRRLDREHLQRALDVHAQFEEDWSPLARKSIQRHRDVLAGILEGVGAVAITGGHVAVLANRMRLFGVLDFFGDRPVLAWSAGAMALGERIVLFHDSPPQGAGNPEVLDAGLGLYGGVVPLPSASSRLRLDDPVRVSLFARRFAPDLCLPLDARMSVRRVGDEWQAGERSRQLSETGTVDDWAEAAA